MRGQRVHFGIIFLLVMIQLIITNCSKSDKQDKPQSNKHNIVKIGVIMPLTGAAAQYGKNCMNGIKLAQKEINETNNNIRLELIFEDDKTEPKEAVSAFKKLISIHKVPAIIGPLPSSNAMAAAPLANENRVVLFSPGASSPRLTNAGTFVFRNWQSDAFEAKIMADFLLKRDLKGIAILFVNNDFGLALKDYFKDYFERIGGKVLLSESFEQNATDFRAQLTKIKAKDPKGLYLLSYPQETSNIVNQARQIGFDMNIFGVAAMEDPSLVSLAGKNAEGIIYTKAVEPDDNDPVYKHFTSSYLHEYGDEPGLIADTGYDALKMLYKAISLSKTIDGYTIAEKLKTIKNYTGASGQMSFDENGDIIKPIGIKTLKKGEFIWLDKSIEK